jgi:glutathione synthase/RimK-type ligase-like ATP-grasp enzyme
MTKRLAIISCSELMDLMEDDRLLLPEFHALGIETTICAWDDPSIDWGTFDCLLFRSAWDVWHKPAAYRTWLQVLLKDGVRSVNPIEAILWNFDKGRICELGDRGVSITPSLSFDALPTSMDRIEELDVEDYVLKPRVGGSGFLVERLRAAELAQRLADPLAFGYEEGFLVQAYLPEIQTAGETSAHWVAGEWTHAIQKLPATGEFRVHEEYGGRFVESELDVEAMNWCENVIGHAAECCDVALNFARVDFVQTGEGPRLVELELIDPALRLDMSPRARKLLIDCVRFA